MTDELPGRDEVRAFGDTRAAFWADPPRGACTRDECAETDAILYGDPPVCADCYRATQASRDRAYPCDRCGEGPAFRDPLHRRDEMLCPGCHERADYVPGKRAMISQVEVRQGVVHSQGQKAVCIAAGRGTDCAGEIKPRGKLGTLCNKHHDPKRYL